MAGNRVAFGLPLNEFAHGARILIVSAMASRGLDSD